jgi:hypothetical protein
VGDEQSVAVDQSYAPYGHRPDRDKFGDDGSGTIIDRNGVLIWSNKNGERVTIPNATFAKTLYVSNTECLVYSNRNNGWNGLAHQAQIVIYRRGATGGIISSKSLTINGTVLDTVSVTPTTYGYLLLSGKRFDDGEESTQITEVTEGGNPPVTKEQSKKFDKWDTLNLTLNIITWDGQLRTLAGSNLSIPKSAVSTFSDGVALGYGSDGSLLLSMTTAGTFLDRYDDLDPAHSPQKYRRFGSAQPSTMKVFVSCRLPSIDWPMWTTTGSSANASTLAWVPMKWWIFADSPTALLPWSHLSHFQQAKMSCHLRNIRGAALAPTSTPSIPRAHRSNFTGRMPRSHRWALRRPCLSRFPMRRHL